MNTQETTIAKRSVIASLASKLDVDPAKLYPMLKRTCFAACRTDDEFMAMCMVANTYGLNPVLKEIYAFQSGRNGAVVPIVGVDGWTRIINSHPAIDGIEFDEPEDGSRCTAVIYRKDRQHPVKVTEWMDVCKGSTPPWLKWPRRMLRHKALIQCARIAFGFSGIYDPDEARRIEESTNLQVPETQRNAQAKRTRRASAVEILEADDIPESALLPEAEAPAVKEPRKEAVNDEPDFLKAS